MNFLTEEKLTIVGAAGMIGSNMVPTAIMMGLTPNICAYDPYAPALEGVAEEMFLRIRGRESDLYERYVRGARGRPLRRVVGRSGP